MISVSEIKPIHIRTYAGVQEKKKKVINVSLSVALIVHPYVIFYLTKQFTYTAGQIRISEPKWE